MPARRTRSCQIALRSNDFRIAVFAGDGIGNEITEPCLVLLERAV